MIKTLIGLILLLMPFLLINRFVDKRNSFFYILSFLVFFHLLAAIVTQFLGIFSYWVVVFINLILCLIVIFKIDFKELGGKIRKIKIDWMLVLIIIILIIELFSVHYNYSGKVVDINQNIKEAKNMRYAYPYYSDEWSAVGFIKYSIESGKLPFANPLWNNYYFPNPEFAFHSFLSELFLLLDLNPLIHYSLFALFFGALICILVYFILRVNEIGKFYSAAAALSVPYIVNSANLPGIWYLIPIIPGLICLLLSFIFISAKDNKMILFANFLALIFYPPLFILSAFSLTFYFISLHIPKKEKMKYLGIYFLICLIAATIISFKLIFGSSENFNFINYIFSKIYYMTFTKDSIPDYSIWKVIPLWSLIFAVLGVIKILSEEFLSPKNLSNDFFGLGMKKEKETWKKSWLIAPILIGLIYWLIYSFVFWRFIIEYQRVIFASSVLIALFSGFGINYAANYLEQRNFISKNILKFLFVLILILFLFFSFFYTQRDNWNNLKLYSKGNKVGAPAPPANNYLIEEDLRLFGDIKKRSFIAPPWKGLVIGVSTGNYPLESKQSTITNSILKYNDFINSNCNSKIQLAKKYRIDYAYSGSFNCTGFNFIGESKEGLFLYELI